MRKTKAMLNSAIVLYFVICFEILMQVPPESFRSMMATFLPAPARRPARNGPAWPVPIMMAS